MCLNLSCQVFQESLHFILQFTVSTVIQFCFLGGVLFFIYAASKNNSLTPLNKGDTTFSIFEKKIKADFQMKSSHPTKVILIPIKPNLDHYSGLYYRYLHNPLIWLYGNFFIILSSSCVFNDTVFLLTIRKHFQTLLFIKKSDRRALQPAELPIN